MASRACADGLEQGNAHLAVLELQVLDTSWLSIDHETFAWPSGELSRRHIVDAFATIAWFRALAVKASASSISDMVRFYEPEAKSSAEQFKRCHRQWAERLVGRRTPRRAMIDVAELRCPGSAAMFSLPLWPALRTDWTFERSLMEVSRALPAHIRDELVAELRRAPRWLADGRARAMKRRGTLDDLACLLMLLRRANDTGAEHAAYQLARGIKRVLLLQAGWLLAYGLVQPLVEHVVGELFGKAPAHFRPWVTAEEYFHSLDWLVNAAPRHLPGIVDGFGPEEWLRAADLALSHADSL